MDSLAIFVKSNMCSETNGSGDLIDADSESLWEELAGKFTSACNSFHILLSDCVEPSNDELLTTLCM
jgi:hypothetical protein